MFNQWECFDVLNDEVSKKIHSGSGQAIIDEVRAN